MPTSMGKRLHWGSRVFKRWVSGSPKCLWVGFVLFNKRTSFGFIYCFPSFLKVHCFLRLHEFLLQPRGVKLTERRNTRNSEQTVPLKIKKAVGKIRVEGNLTISTDFYPSNTMNLNRILIVNYGMKWRFSIDVF